MSPSLVPRPPCGALLLLALACGPARPAPSESFPELITHRAPRPLAADAVTEGWPTFLGPRHDAHSAETRLTREWPDDGPPLVWEMTRGEGYACPAVEGDYLVFPHRIGDEAIIDCLHPETGQRHWQFRYPTDYQGQYIKNAGPRATPAIDRGRVYVHGVEGVLHCLDLKTGAVVWRRDLAEELKVGDQFFGVVSSPLIYGDTLIQNVGAPGGPCVAAFDRETGKTVWGSGEKWGPSCASPVLAKVHGQDWLFVLTGGKSRPPTGGLMVLQPGDGKVLLEHPFRSRTYESVNGASPVVGGNQVFLTSSYGVGTAALALAADGTYTQSWKNRHLGFQFANPVFHEGYLYGVDGRSDRMGAVVCIDPATGEEVSRTDIELDESVTRGGKTETRTFSVGEGSLLVADGQFLCLGDNGHLLWLDVSPQGAKIRARAWLFGANECWTPLVLSRGLLYVCQNNPERFGDRPARLLCYDLRAQD